MSSYTTNMVLVGYDIVIAKSALRASTISYPTRARGIIVKYFRAKWRLLLKYLRAILLQTGIVSVIFCFT